MDFLRRQEGSAQEVKPLGPEALHRRAAEASPLPIVLTRGEGHVVQYVNPAFCALIARAPGDLLGKALAAFFQEASALTALVDRVYQSGVTDLASALTCATARGALVHCIAVVGPLLDTRACPLGLVVHLVDTTEQAAALLREAEVVEDVRQANEALVLAGLREQELAERATRLYEQAQRATRVREDLLAIVSHDLRDPLGVVLMNVDILSRTTRPDDDGKVHKRLDSIRRSAERMHYLIRDLLDAASVEAGRLSLERRPIEVAPLVAEATEALLPLVTSKSLSLKSELPAELPPVSADAVRLQQVLANLLGNAIKFTPQGGRITLRAEPSGDAVRFSVTDTGPGIAGEDLPHLFDRFWQARRSAGLGSGLGLFIVQGIIEALGGRVWVESAVGVGSTFFFTVPTAPREAEAERS